MNETEAPGAGWQFDPTERHQLRWWDGSSWSDRVCDQAAQTIDSMEAILRAPLPIDDPSDGVLARRLRWQCVGGRTFRGAFRVQVLDSDERVVACVQYSGGLKTITVGEREYQAKPNFQWRSLVDLANDGEEVAAMAQQRNVEEDAALVDPRSRHASSASRTHSRQGRAVDLHVPRLRGKGRVHDQLRWVG